MMIREHIPYDLGERVPILRYDVNVPNDDRRAYIEKAHANHMNMFSQS
jgi:hypothetical protein